MGVVHVVRGGRAAVLHGPPALVVPRDRPDALVPDDVVDAEFLRVCLGIGHEGVPLGLAGGCQRDHKVGRKAGRVTMGIGGALAVAADGLDVEHRAEDVDQLRQLRLDRAQVVVGLGRDRAARAAAGGGGDHQRVVSDLAGLRAVVYLGAGPGEVGAVDVVDRRVLLGLLAGLRRSTEGVGELGGERAV